VTTVWIKYLSEIEIGSNKKNIFDYEGGRSDTNYSTDAGSLRKLISVYSAISNGNNIKIIEKYNLNYQYTNTKFKMRLTNNIRTDHELLLSNVSRKFSTSDINMYSYLLAYHQENEILEIDDWGYYKGINSDQLAFVLSPEATKHFKSSPNQVISSPENNTVVNELCYQYRYDGRNRLVEKKLPGKGWEYMVYDQQDRLILTQDFLMRPEKQWLFTKYDKYGRVIYTGITADPDTRSGIQGYVDLHFPQNNEGSGGFTANGLTVKYSKDQAFPTYINTLLSVNYYDIYPDTGTDFPDLTQTDTYNQSFLTDNMSSVLNTKGLLTASFVKTIGSDRWTKTYTYYDRKGRAIYTYTKNYLGGYTKTGSKLDFTGQVLASFTRHKRSSDNLPAEVNITERFVYDSQNRLVKHYHNVNSTGYDVVLADNTYDELGRLVIKKSGAEVNAGTDTQSKAPLQSISYVYNIRGWLNGINLKNVNSVLQLDSDKLFSYRIRYEDSEISSLRKYNGNISETQWSYGTATSQKYQYHYDALNRLTLADSKRISTTGTSDSGYYNESLTYDLNGNIKTLDRYGLASRETSGAVKMDELTYNYDNVNKSNRLISVLDATSNKSGYPGGGGTIAYDGNGNVLTMPDKGITTAIEYNYLNLPQKIIQAGNPTEYTYRADGEKVKKTFTINGQNIYTDYLDGFVYTRTFDVGLQQALTADDSVTRLATTANQEESLTLDDKIVQPFQSSPVLVYFPTSEGFYDFENSEYIYQYKDHLDR